MPITPARSWPAPVSNPRRVCRPGCARRAVSVWPGNGMPAGNAATGRTARPAIRLKDIAAKPKDDSEAGPRQDASSLYAVAACVAMIALLLTYGVKLALILASLVFAFAFLLRWFRVLSGLRSEPQPATEPDDLFVRRPSKTRSEVSRAKVRRAWQAAVLAALAFPPLSFYSMWLLWKLRRRHTPLSRADTWRTWIALLLDVVLIIICFACFVMVLLALIDLG